MKKRDVQRIGDVLPYYLKMMHLHKGIKERSIVKAWPKVTGEVVNRYTLGLEVKNRVLYVQLSASELKSNLMMDRKSLVDHLNLEVGEDVIEDIQFR